MSALAEALAGGGKFVKWAELPQGTNIAGKVASVTMRQAREFQSEKLAHWDDGAPKMQCVITIETALREDGDDDGRRSVSVNLWSEQKKALADACKKASVKEPQVGQQFTAKWVSGVGIAGDPRIFEYTLSGNAAGAVADALGTTAAEATSPAAAAPALTPEAAAAIAGLSDDQKRALGLVSSEPPF